MLSQPLLSLRLPLNRVTGLSTDAAAPGVLIVLGGRVSTHYDGSSFDASDLFDFAAGGLRIVGHDPAIAQYVLAATGESAAACRAAGAPSPCLVPRVQWLARSRLHTVTGFEATLTGDIELAVVRGEPATIHDAFSPFAFAGFGLAAAIAVGWVELVRRKRRERNPWARVRLASRRALRAIRGDPTLDGLRPKIAALIARARHLEEVERTSRRKLRRFDRGALDRRVGELATANLPGADAAMASLSVEWAEATLLQADIASAAIEMQRIESTLRLVALRAGSRLASQAGVDAVNALKWELDIRDSAMAEADRL